MTGILKELLTLLESNTYSINKRCSIDLSALEQSIATQLIANPETLGTFVFEDDEGRFRWFSSANLKNEDASFSKSARMACDYYKRLAGTSFCRLNCTSAKIR